MPGSARPPTRSSPWSWGRRRCCSTPRPPGAVEPAARPGRVVNALPSRLLVVTDRHQATAPLEAITRQAVLAGVRWIWLRDRDMPVAGGRDLAGRLLAITRRHGAFLS